MQNLKLKKLTHLARLPTYGTPGAACFDLYAVIEGEPISIAPGAVATIRTGLAFEIDPEWRMDIFSRSGHGFKSQVSLVNSVGKIDADYRNEVMVGLRNDGMQNFVVNHGDRIAQAELNPVHRVCFVEVQELTDTERGLGGFGSTGA